MAYELENWLVCAKYRFQVTYILKYRFVRSYEAKIQVFGLQFRLSGFPGFRKVNMLAVAGPAAATPDRNLRLIGLAYLVPQVSRS